MLFSLSLLVMPPPATGKSVYCIRVSPVSECKGFQWKCTTTVRAGWCNLYRCLPNPGLLLQPPPPSLFVERLAPQPRYESDCVLFSKPVWDTTCRHDLLQYAQLILMCGRFADSFFSWQACARYEGKFDWLALGDDDTVFMYNRIGAFLSHIDHTQVPRLTTIGSCCLCDRVWPTRENRLGAF